MDHDDILSVIRDYGQSDFFFLAADQILHTVFGLAAEAWCDTWHR